MITMVEIMQLYIFKGRCIQRVYVIIDIQGLCIQWVHAIFYYLGGGGGDAVSDKEHAVLSIKRALYQLPSYCT